VISADLATLDGFLQRVYRPVYVCRCACGKPFPWELRTCPACGTAREDEARRIAAMNDLDRRAMRLLVTRMDRNHRRRMRRRLQRAA
jgi:rRNA maturation endonuclease Nob1